MLCSIRGAETLQAELELLGEAVRRIEAAARSVWPGCRAALFGSQATGLALPGADLDVVVLGASSELQRAGSGFTKASMPEMIRVQRHLIRSDQGVVMLGARGELHRAESVFIRAMSRCLCAANATAGAVSGLGPGRGIATTCWRDPQCASLFNCTACAGCI